MIYLDQNTNARAYYQVDGAGNIPNGPATLAYNIAIAANAGSSPVTASGGSYIFDAQFTGASLKLQTLGADGATWRDVTTLNASGAIGVVIGSGASVRVYNPNGAGLTGVYATLT